MLIANSKGHYHTFLILLAIPFDPFTIQVRAERLALLSNLSGILCWHCSRWCLIHFICTACRRREEILYLISPWGRNTLVKGAAIYGEEINDPTKAAENQLSFLIETFLPLSGAQGVSLLPVIEDPLLLEGLVLMMGDPESDFHRLKKLWSLARSWYSKGIGIRSINCSIDPF